MRITKEEQKRRMVFARTVIDKGFPYGISDCLKEDFAKILVKHMYKPNLACATTNELINELKARSDLKYRTID